MMILKRTLASLAALSTTCLLVACDGSGGSSSSTPSTNNEAVHSLPESGDMEPDVPGSMEPDESEREGMDGSPVSASFLNPEAIAAGPALADIEGLSFYASSPEHALLQGPVIGRDARSTREIRRDVPFSVDRIADGLALEHVWVAEDRGGDFSAIYGVIQNTSGEYQCGVETRVIRPLDAAGENLLGTDSRSFRTACIAAGERAHFAVGFLAADAGEIASVSIEVLAALRSGPESDFERNALLRPIEAIGYTVVDGEPRITLRNPNAETVDLSGAVVFLHDEQGYPVHFYFAETRFDVLAPGEEVEVLPNPDLAFDGASSTVRIRVFASVRR